MHFPTYGWWQDKVYRFNDPDHIVLRDATDGENRARVSLRGLSLEFFIAGMISNKGGSKEVKETRKIFDECRDQCTIANAWESFIHSQIGDR